MLKKRMGAGLALVLFVTFAFSGTLVADIVFQSDFTGTTGEQISSLPEWSDACAPAGTTRLIDDNMGAFYGNGTGWLYSSIRADKSAGVAQNFNPINETGNRFEYTVVKASSTDPTLTSKNRIWVGTQSDAVTSGYNVIGQRILVDMTWNKTSSVATVNLAFAVNVTATTNIGATASTFTPTVDLDGGESIRVALEVRDDAGSNDVRMAYQTYKSGAWGEWTYSNWYDPTDAAYGANAFASGWKTSWANNTYMYLEQNCRTSYASTTWFDNVTVTGTVPEPATLGMLCACGYMFVARRRRR